MRAFLLLPLLSAMAACWSPRSFAPLEHVDAIGPGGVPAAFYRVPAAEAGAPSTAEVRVWSNGARARFTDDGREVVELHVGFALENNGKDTVQLDLGSVACDDLVVDGAVLGALLPLRIDGDGTAPPDTTARVELFFQPAAAVPRAIDRFAVRFTVLAGEREALQQVTPFGPWVRPSYPDAYYWGGWGWGWTWGYGWGCGVGWHVHPYCWH